MQCSFTRECYGDLLEIRPHIYSQSNTSPNDSALASNACWMGSQFGSDFQSFSSQHTIWTYDHIHARHRCPHRCRYDSISPLHRPPAQHTTNAPSIVLFPFKDPRESVVRLPRELVTCRAINSQANQAIPGPRPFGPAVQGHSILVSQASPFTMPHGVLRGEASHVHAYLRRSQAEP